MKLHISNKLFQSYKDYYMWLLDKPLISYVIHVSLLQKNKQEFGIQAKNLKFWMHLRSYFALYGN